MKVLIATDWYAPVINGVVTSVLNLIEGLKAEGHDVRVLTLANGVRAKKEKNVYYIGSLNANMIYPYARIAAPKRNHRVINELIDWKPDVIHTQCEFSTFYYARKISKKTGAPIVHTYHTVYEGYTHYFCPSKMIGKKAVTKFTCHIAKKTQSFIVPTEKMYRMLKEYNVQTPMEVIPSGIDVDKFIAENPSERAVIRQKYGVKDDECLIVSIGRLAKEKNLEEILSFLATDMPDNVKFMIVGGGPYMEHLEKRARELSIYDRIIFAGMVQPSIVDSYYKAGDVFVSASTSETQGLTYMEAMASGLALLCRYDSCLEDVIENGKNGYIYQNEAEFHDTLRELSLSREKREMIGNKAKETIIRKYSVDAFAKACEQLYIKCGD